MLTHPFPHRLSCTVLPGVVAGTVRTWAINWRTGGSWLQVSVSCTVAAVCAQWKRRASSSEGETRRSSLFTAGPSRQWTRACFPPLCGSQTCWWRVTMDTWRTASGVSRGARFCNTGCTFSPTWMRNARYVLSYVGKRALPRWGRSRSNPPGVRGSTLHAKASCARSVRASRHHVPGKDRQESHARFPFRCEPATRRAPGF
jgi:hypothetical protein